MNRLIIILAATFFVSCSTFHISPEDSEKKPVPDNFSLYGERQQFADKWWETFNSTELNQLIETSLCQNLSIKQAASRLKQAQAVSVQVGSSERVKSDVDASASSGRKAIANNSSHTESYSLGIGASYELDLWGRVGNKVRATEFAEDATAEDLYTVRMTIASSVALRWLELAENRQNIDLLNRQIKANKKISELIELRFRSSQATALDVLQQREITAQAESLLPLAQAQQNTIKHELAILLGKAPNTNLDLIVERLPQIPGLPEIGVPADLLAKRPDIRSAGMKLRSSEWTVAAAKADRLPSIKLTGSARYNSNEIDSLFDNWLANLAGSISLPIIDGGYRKAEVDRTKAVVDERLASYRETVLNALKEVENSLSLEKHQVEYINALNKRLDLKKTTKQEATARYRKGLETYLPVLSSLISEQKLERDILSAELTKLKYRIQLHRALGGNWMRKMENEK